MTHTAPGAPPLELVVETLTPTAAPTIIAVDGHPKAWVPLRNSATSATAWSPTRSARW